MSVGNEGVLGDKPSTSKNLIAGVLLVFPGPSLPFSTLLCATKAGLYSGK